jgi:adenylate cyclase
MIKVADIFQASILIVDDKEANVSLLDQMLRGAGYSNISSTSHPREVAHLHRENHYALILLDLQMPGMDGFEVMAELKTIETDGYLPVLVVTAQPDLKLRALKAGAKDFVSKPFELAEVQMRVYNLLEVRLLHLEARRLFLQVEAEQKVSERLLLNVMPAAIVQRLKAQPRASDGSIEIIADSFPEATILFAGLHDFSRLTESMPAAEVVALLNRIYSDFDTLTEKLGLEKIKILGESYMIAAGVPVARADHAEATAEAALALQELIALHDTPNGETFSLRIGINTGPVVAGVIGKTKFAYDVWGETVNTAWHMETYGSPGYIQVNHSTYAKLRDKYDFEDRGEFSIKNEASLKTYFLKGRKPEPSVLTRKDPILVKAA